MTQQTFFPVLYVLLISIVSWTVTKEEVFAELREWAEERMDLIHAEDASTQAGLWMQTVRRKLYYPLTCQFCFSFWVTLGVELLFRLHLFSSYLLMHAFFWASANATMTLYEAARVRIAERRMATEHNTYATRQASYVTELTRFSLEDARRQRAEIEAHRRLQEKFNQAEIQNPGWPTGKAN